MSLKSLNAAIDRALTPPKSGALPTLTPAEDKAILAEAAKDPSAEVIARLRELQKGAGDTFMASSKVLADIDGFLAANVVSTPEAAPAPPPDIGWSPVDRTMSQADEVGATRLEGTLQASNDGNYNYTLVLPAPMTVDGITSDKIQVSATLLGASLDELMGKTVKLETEVFAHPRFDFSPESLSVIIDRETASKLLGRELRAPFS